MQESDNQSGTIFASEDARKGRFSNTMFISHAPEEFILDFIMDSPSGRELVSRIVVTPGHAKRIMNAILANVEMYEKKYGEIHISESIPGPDRGLMS